MKTKPYQILVRSLLLLFTAMLLGMSLKPARTTAAYPPRAAGTINAGWSAIDSYVEGERQVAKVPGLALAIVQGDHIVHLTGFGQADSSGRAVTGQTPFSIGLATKP